MKIKIIDKGEQNQLLKSSDITNDNWGQKATEIALNGFNDDLNFGMSLNLESISKGINHYLKASPIYILGGEDTSDGKFHLDLMITAINLTVPKPHWIQLSADFTGRITWKGKEIKATVSISVELKDDVLELTDEYDFEKSTYSLFMNAESLGWVAVNGWKVFNAGVVAKMINYIVKDKLKHIFLYSFELNNEQEIELGEDGPKVKLRLPLPVASELKLIALTTDRSVGMIAPKTLNLNYCGNSSYAQVSAMKLAQQTGGSKMIAAAIGAKYFYDQAAVVLNALVKEYAIGGSDRPISVLPMGGSNTKFKLGITSPINLQPTDSSISKLEISELNVVLGINAQNKFTVMVQVVGKSQSTGIKFAVGLSVTADCEKPVNGNQNIHIEMTEDFLDLKIPWWMKVIKNLFRAFTGGIVGALISHFVPKVIKKKIEEKGSFDVPNSFADKVYVDDLVFGRDQGWFGPTLVDPNQ